MRTRIHPGLLIAPVALAALALLPACASDRASRSDAATAEAGAPPLFRDLGDYAMPVTTSFPEARRYFDQGLVWMYSFNHDEAIRNFEHAARLDPGFAMAPWGAALCHGPHINNPAMTPDSARAAWDALERAQAAAANASPRERALIDALRARYAPPDDPRATGIAPRTPLDRAYADAMARVHAAFPDDPDVATLYAESLMDLRPWDLWSADGQPRPETPQIVRALEGVLARTPDHPGANHLYIHAVEASPHPELADGAAERLRTLVPASGHMVHMPSHIDVRVGRWGRAADQNQAATRAHAAYEERSPRQRLYRAYMLHNDHFLAYACMMEGRERDARAAARAMIDSIPEDFYRDFAPVADVYSAIEVESLMRFGRWDDILALPQPRAELPITRAIWRFAGGIALAAKGDTTAARAEQRLFRAQASALPEDAMMAINPARVVLRLADEMLEGEILYREGDLTGAVARLRAAVEIEDTLRYMEPPDWVQPVRHALGAVLLDAGRPAEAETVYREDLRRWPENGWALFGMAQSLSAQGRDAEAAQFEARFKKAWERADTTLAASCFCSQRRAQRE